MIIARVIFLENIKDNTDSKNRGLAKKEKHIMSFACFNVIDLFSNISLVYLALEGNPEINASNIIIIELFILKYFFINDPIFKFINMLPMTINGNKEGNSLNNHISVEFLILIITSL